MTAGWLDNSALDEAMRVTVDVGSTRDFVSATLDLDGRIAADMQQQSIMPGAGSKIILVAQGGSIRVTSGLNDVTAEAGDVLLIDSDHPCRISAQDLRIRVICLPHAGLPGVSLLLPASADGPKVLNGAHQPVAVFAAMLADVCGRNWSSRAARQEMVAMVGNCLTALNRNPAHASVTEVTMPDPSSALDAFLMENLASTSLGAVEIAHHLGVSSASVYRRFARFGGVANYVRGFRLDRSFESLLQRDGRREALDAVAAKHGFSNRSVFSKAFKRRFGFSPVSLTKQQPDPKDIAKKAARKAASLQGRGEQPGNPANFHGWMTRNALSAMLAARDRPGRPA